MKQIKGGTLGLLLVTSRMPGIMPCIVLLSQLFYERGIINLLILQMRK